MESKTVIYLDHAASSWPKPPSVIRAMVEAVERCGANPGRGSHKMALDASRIVFGARQEAAALFGIRNANDIAFTLNTTEALNLAMKGFPFREGDHVICTSVEHNSVRRPLEYLRKTKHLTVTYLETNEKGELDLLAVKKAFRANTRLFVCTHSSNLLGSILPITEIAELCRGRNVKLLVDAAQTAGTYPLDVLEMGIDLLAFPGHKGLLGPQGTGGLYIHPKIELEPLLHGGTGSQSEAVDQPTVRPDRYEAGTQNVPGLAGLKAGLSYIREVTVEQIHRQEWMLTQRLMESLMAIRGVMLLGPELGQTKTGIVSFNLEAKDSAEVAFLLDKKYRIAVRAGYHCTPLAHGTAGTLDRGAVRASVGYSTNSNDVDALAEAIREIAAMA